MKDAKLARLTYCYCEQAARNLSPGRFYFVGECNSHESLRVEISYKP
jgi:hypothetical protein